MLASLMFKTRALLDDLEDCLSTEVLRVIGMDATAFAAAGMTLDYDEGAARFTIGNCAPCLAVREIGRRQAIWELGFKSFTLESPAGRTEYTAAADRGEIEPPHAWAASAGTGLGN